MWNCAHDGELLAADDYGAGNTAKYFDHDEEAKGSMGLTEMNHETGHEDLDRHGDD